MGLHSTIGLNDLNRNSTDDIGVMQISSFFGDKC